MANLLHRSSFSGISLEPMLSYICHLFGKKVYKMDVENGTECSVERILRILSDDGFSVVELVPGTEMTFKAHLNINPNEHSISSYSKLVFSVIGSYIGCFRGKNLKIGRIDASRWERNEILVELVEVPYEKYGDYSKYLVGGINSCDFTIYYSKDRFVPVVGGLMNRIVELVSTIPMSSQQLAEHLGLPQSTVSGYLKKLEEDGIIAQKRIRKNVEYYLTSIKAMDWKKNDLGVLPPLGKVLEKAACDHKHFSRYLVHCFIYLGHMLGIDMEIWMNFVGKRAGKRIVEHNPDCNMEELFDRITERGEDTFSSSMAILSCTPLSVTKILNEDISEFLAEYYRILYDAMFVSFMETLSGIPYRVKSSSVYGEGNRGYRTCIIPSFP